PALQAVAVHIALRERERMVDADDDRSFAAHLGGQPFGQLAAAPVHVLVLRIAFEIRLMVLMGGEDPQLRNAVARFLAPRIVDTDVLLEISHGSPPWRRGSYQSKRRRAAFGGGIRRRSSRAWPRRAARGRSGRAG